MRGSEALSVSGPLAGPFWARSLQGCRAIEEKQLPRVLHFMNGQWRHARPSVGTIGAPLTRMILIQSEYICQEGLTDSLEMCPI